MEVNIGITMEVNIISVRERVGGREGWREGWREGGTEGESVCLCSKFHVRQRCSPIETHWSQA